MVKKYLSYLVSPKKILLYLMKHYGGWIGDEQFLKLYYRLELGKKLGSWLQLPKEKLQ